MLYKVLKGHWCDNVLMCQLRIKVITHRTISMRNWSWYSIRPLVPIFFPKKHCMKKSPFAFGLTQGNRCRGIYIPCPIIVTFWH